MTQPWVKRRATSEDEDGLVYLWLKSYAHSPENIIRGAHKDHSPAEIAYWAEHAPIVEALIRSATTEVLCDPQRVHATSAGPAQIYAFACTTGDVVHWVGVKRKYARDPELKDLCVDMVRDLLGERLERACTYSHELVEMGWPNKPGKCGTAIPRGWRLDRWWVARQMLGGARRLAA